LQESIEIFRKQLPVDLVSSPFNCVKRMSRLKMHNDEAKDGENQADEAKDEDNVEDE